MPKTNTQNPNEQNRNTNTPNGANYTNPLQNEFENSATYRVIHKVGDKVTESVNNLDERADELSVAAGAESGRYVPLFLHADGVLELQAPEYKPESGSEQRARRTV